jgi:SAM-dependent methyltransferase
MNTMTNFAPIVLFVYNRPQHTRQTVEALQKNELAADSDLIIYADAAKSDNAEPAVQAVRAYIRTITGFKSVRVVERPYNFGLANSIIDGVTSIVNEYGRVIVLEDDLVTSPYFLRYMNDGLVRYEHEERVISIHGYIYPVKDVLPGTFFIRGADCWGWATWKRGWDLFQVDGSKLLDELQRKKLTKDFDFGGSYPYTRMLKKQIEGKNNSWAIRWYASAFLANKLTLYPGVSLVLNIGHDGSGTHCGVNDGFSGEMVGKWRELSTLPPVENMFARESVMNFFSGSRYGLLYRGSRLIQRKLKMLYKIQQFNPNMLAILINPFYFARKGLFNEMRYFAPKMSGAILDVGCGQKPYELLFSNVSQYDGLEYDSPANRISKRADYFYDGTVFPFAEERYDGVLCNQVLEHVFNPDQFLHEIHKVLKNDGALLLTVPFVWDEHEQPWDFARYSTFGLRSLLERNGFEVLEQHKTNADARVLFQLINAYLFKVLHTKNKILNLFACMIFIAPITLIGIVISKLLPVNPDLYLDQVVLAKKVG